MDMFSDNYRANSLHNDKREIAGTGKFKANIRSMNV